MTHQLTKSIDFRQNNVCDCHIRSMYLFIQCVTEGEGDRVVRRAYTGVIHCVFDQIPNLQNCFITANKNLGGEGASER
jgi:hypothetical protein